jgi:hypothetical protein
LFGKEARQSSFVNRRPILHADQKPMPESPFGETPQLSKDFVKKIGEHAECDKILNGKYVKLSKGKLIGTWNGIYAVEHKFIWFCMEQKITNQPCMVRFSIGQFKPTLNVQGSSAPFHTLCTSAPFLP